MLMYLLMINWRKRQEKVFRGQFLITNKFRFLFFLFLFVSLLFIWWKFGIKCGLWLDKITEYGSNSVKVVNEVSKNVIIFSASFTLYFPYEIWGQVHFSYFKWSNCIIVFTRVKPSNVPCKFQCMTKKMRRYGRQNAYIRRDKKLKNISNMKIRSKIVPNDVFSHGIKLKPLNSGWFNIWNILI